MSNLKSPIDWVDATTIEMSESLVRFSKFFITYRPSFAYFTFDKYSIYSSLISSIKITAFLFGATFVTLFHFSKSWIKPETIFFGELY